MWKELVAAAEKPGTVSYRAATRQEYLRGLPARQAEGTAWSLCSALGSNSLVYALTGDREAGDFAKKVLLQMVTWDTWSNRIYHTRYKLKVGLRMGRVAMGAAMAYDMVYDLLTEEERAKVRAGILKLGIQPVYDEYVTGKRRGFMNNWMGVNVGGAGACALAIAGDDPKDPHKMDPYINGFLDRYRAFIDYCAGDDGAYGEGVGYLSYGFEIVPFLVMAAKNVVGADLFRDSNLGKVWLYPAYMQAPGGKGYVNFNDSSYGCKVADHLYAMCAAATKNPHPQWLFHHGRNFTPSAGIMNLLMYDTNLKPKPLDDLPTSRYFPSFGQAVFRTGWGDEDILFAFKSSRMFTHGHSDPNSFVLYAFGEPLAIDPGCGGGGYTNPLYKTYYRYAEAHNLVLMNRKRPWEWRTRGRTSDFVGSRFYDAVAGNVSNKGVTHRREVVFVKPHYVVIFDRIAAPKDAEFNWLLHGPGKAPKAVSVKGNTVTLTRGKARLEAKMLLPAKLSHRIIDGHAGDGVGPHDYVSFDTPTKAAQAQFLSVLWPYRGNRPKALDQVTTIQAAGVLGVRVRRDGVTDMVLFADGKPGIAAEGVSTNGTSCTVSAVAGGGCERFALHQGTWLKHGEQTLLALEKPGSAAFGRAGAKGWDGFVDMAAAGSVTVRVGSRPSAVRVDGKTLPAGGFSYDPKTRTVRFRVPARAHTVTVSR